MPDLALNNDKDGDFIKKLENSHIIFDYAIAYIVKNKPSINESFTIPETAFNDFIAFVSSHTERIPTKSDNQLKELEKQLKADAVTNTQNAISLIKQAAQDEKSQGDQDKASRALCQAYH